MTANEAIDNEAEDHAGKAPEGANSSESQTAPEVSAADAATEALHKAVTEAIAAKENESSKAPDSAPTLTLVPWLSAFDERIKAAPPQAKPSRRFDPLTVAATLAAIGVLAVGALAGVDHMRQSELVVAKAQENQTLVDSVSILKSRIEAIEATRSQEQSAELRKTLAEVKTMAATAQSYGVTIGQMAQRVDRLEKDQNARFDRLSERIDQSASGRFGEIVARLDKLEKKPAASPPAPAVAIAAPPAPTPSPSPAKALTALPPLPPNVSNDITGSIDKPKPVLRGYALEDIRDGMALIDGRDGPYSVSPGDVLPGAGRVLKIERRGRDWVVVTSLGIITTPPEP